MGKIDLLAPEARPVFEAFLRKLEAAGLRYTVTETLRTLAVQEAYYAQGRKPLEEISALRKKAGLYLPGEAGGKRIAAKTMKPARLTGKAADIVPAAGGRIPWNITKENAGLRLAFGRLEQEAGLERGGSRAPLDKYGIGWERRITSFRGRNENRKNGHRGAAKRERVSFYPKRRGCHF